MNFGAEICKFYYDREESISFDIDNLIESIEKDVSDFNVNFPTFTHKRANSERVVRRQVPAKRNLTERYSTNSNPLPVSSSTHSLGTVSESSTVSPRLDKSESASTDVYAEQTELQRNLQRNRTKREEKRLAREQRRLDMGLSANPISSGNFKNGPHAALMKRAQETLRRHELTERHTKAMSCRSEDFNTMCDRLATET